MISCEIFGPRERLIIDKDAVGHPDMLCNTMAGTITIEKNVFFGHRVMLITGTHDYTKFNQERMFNFPSGGHDILIEEGSWICSGVIVIGPCRIGKHSVVGAGAVVTKDVPDFWIVGGNPARLIRELSSK